MENSTASRSKISIILPVYNEESTVRELLDRVWNQPVFDLRRELIIVESNSTDRTRETILRFAKEKSCDEHVLVKLVFQDVARGKGNAVRAGLKEAVGDIIVIQDGDLEYDVRDYPALIEPILAGRTDFVLGSRHLSAGSWKIREFERNPWRAFLLNLGGIFFHAMFNLLYSVRLTDPTTMFKVFRRSCLKGINLISDRFDFDFELLGKLIRAGYTPLEVPVTYRSRGFGEGKKVRIFRDPPTWLWAMTRFRFGEL